MGTPRRATEFGSGASWRTLVEAAHAQPQNSKHSAGTRNQPRSAPATTGNDPSHEPDARPHAFWHVTHARPQNEQGTRSGHAPCLGAEPRHNCLELHRAHKTCARCPSPRGPPSCTWAPENQSGTIRNSLCTNTGGLCLVPPLKLAWPHSPIVLLSTAHGALPDSSCNCCRCRQCFRFESTRLASRTCANESWPLQSLP